MLNRSIAPDFKEIKGINIIQPEEIKFNNGLNAFIFKSSDLNLIKFEFVFNNVLKEEELSFINPILSSMLREGTDTYSSKEIADTIDFYGAYLMPEYSFDHTSLTLYTLKKHVGKLLPVILDILQNSTIPQSELDTLIRNLKQSLKISLEKNEVIARRQFYSEVFSGTRYGVTPTAALYNSILREDLKELYNNQITPSNCTLFISGKVDAEILNLVTDLFGQQWVKTQEIDTHSNPIFNDYKKELIINEKTESIQSAIRLGGLMVNRQHKDFPAIQFVNTLFGGFFGSRLMKNIREDKGFTYSIGSFVGNLKSTGFFTLASEVGVEVTKQTIQEIQKEFEILRQEKVSDTELDLVRNYMQGQLLGSLESIFSHTDKFKTTYFSGLDTSYYEYYTEVIKNMDASKVQDIAIQYFDYDTLFKVVVGKF